MGHIIANERFPVVATASVVPTPPQEMVIAFMPAGREYPGNIEQLIDYIEVPLTLRYAVFTRGMNMSVSAGLRTNWLISNGAYLIEGDGRQRIGETGGIDPMSWSTHAGVAFSVPIHGQLTFRIEPRINYFLGDINEAHPGRFKPYSIGIFSEVQYSLTR